jgi:hypothetical protein
MLILVSEQKQRPAVAPVHVAAIRMLYLDRVSTPDKTGFIEPQSNVEQVEVLINQISTFIQTLSVSSDSESDKGFTRSTPFCLSAGGISTISFWKICSKMLKTNWGEASLFNSDIPTVAFHTDSSQIDNQGSKNGDLQLR